MRNLSVARRASTVPGLSAPGPEQSSRTLPMRMDDPYDRVRAAGGRSTSGATRPEVLPMTDTTTPQGVEGDDTATTIDADRDAVGPAHGRLDDLRLRLHQRPRPVAAAVRQGHAAAVGRLGPHRLDGRRRLGESARRPRREHHDRRHTVVGADERARTRRSAAPPGRMAVLTVPPRRAGRVDVRVEDRQHRPDDGREVYAARR